VSICQKRAPLIIEKNAIGLEIVPASPPLGKVAFLQFYGMSVEIKPGQCWFATMPYKQDSRSRAGRYVLTNIRLKQSIRHSKSMWMCVKAGGLQIITVTALQIADRTNRFGHDNKRFAIRYRCPRDFPWHVAFLSCETNVSNVIILLTGVLYSHHSRPNQMKRMKYPLDNCSVSTVVRASVIR
jgi:hypothetical protein